MERLEGWTHACDEPSLNLPSCHHPESETQLSVKPEQISPARPLPYRTQVKGIAERRMSSVLNFSLFSEGWWDGAKEEGRTGRLSGCRGSWRKALTGGFQPVGTGLRTGRERTLGVERPSGAPSTPRGLASRVGLVPREDGGWRQGGGSPGLGWQVQFIWWENRLGTDICNLKVISSEATVQFTKCVNSSRLTCIIESKLLFWRPINSNSGGWEEAGDGGSRVGDERPKRSVYWQDFVESRPTVGLAAGSACPSVAAHQFG